MKQTITLLSCTLFATITYCQLQWLNPHPSAYHCRKIRYVDIQNCFAFNYNGDLLHSTDQGASWHIQHRFPETAAFDIKDSVAIIADSKRLFLSADTGKSWTSMAVNFTETILDVNIVSKDSLFLLGTYSVFKSVNGGKNWQAVYNSNSENSTLQFINSKVGFLGNNSLLKTIDGGATWQTIFTGGSTTSRVRALRFYNTSIGYAWRQSGNIYSTTNGGASWQATSILFGVNSISAPAALTAFLAGENGAMYKTTDGGINWGPVNNGLSGINNTLYSVDFITPQVGGATGLGGQIISTTTGGTSWKYNTISMTDVAGIQFPGKKTGYICLKNFIAKTINGGNSWDTLPLPAGIGSSKSYARMAFFSPDTGFVTSGSVVYNSTDGGHNWQQTDLTNGTIFSGNIIACDKLNDSVAYLTISYNYASYGHAVFRTNDRGVSWRKMSESDNPLNIIQFLSESAAISAQGYALYKSIDTAKTWQPLASLTNTVAELYFPDSLIGFRRVNGSIPDRSLDGGKTWEQFYGNWPGMGVLLDAQTGFGITSGSLLKTNNGGLTWDYIDKPAYAVNTMAIRQDSLVFFGGANGEITFIPVDSSKEVETSCQGGTITFQATISSPVFSLKWQVNKDSVFKDITDDGVYAGTKTTQLTIYNMPAEWSDYQYRCYPDTGRVFTAHLQQKWTGAVNNLWETPGNWSCGFVPGRGTDAVVDSGSIIINNNTTIRSLKLGPAVSLSIAPGIKLTILH